MSVAERRLNEPEVSGLPIEVHSEGVAGGVNCEVTFNTSLVEPMMEAELDLASTELATGTRGE